LFSDRLKVQHPEKRISYKQVEGCHNAQLLTRPSDTSNGRRVPLASLVDETIIRQLLREYHPRLTEQQLIVAGHAIAQEIELMIYDRIRCCNTFPAMRVVRGSS
jgi:hypothetical protein